MKYDCAGYATKNNIKCSDGRTIRQNAFSEQDGEIVPLVWQHQHDDPSNFLGHALLENREDGVYAYCSFNETESGKTAKELVKHGDIKCFSIFATELKHMARDVIHGVIKEVSLVMMPANPGATIEALAIEHSDGSFEELDDEAIITAGTDLETEVEKAKESSTPASKQGTELSHSSEGGKSMADLFKEMPEEYKNVCYYMVSQLMEKNSEPIQHGNKEGGKEAMHRNLFEKEKDPKTTLTHAQFKEIVKDAQECGSFRQSFLAHAQSYGIENIEILFPDAKNVTPTPDYIKRDTEWVAEILNGVKHSPFSRIKSTAADITADEARARGYVKGNLKKEEVIKLLKRTVSPTTIYKKQKLDRDDLIDITDLQVVSWLWSEMRMMLNEELARAILVGDGREAVLTNGESNPDKIDEDHIRPIWKEPDMYAERITIPADATPDDMVEAVIRNRKHYKGKGSPKLYADDGWITDIQLLKDKIGRRIYRTKQEIANEMNVAGITEVPVMENQVRTDESGKKYKLLGIIVNLSDYTLGTDKGGEIAKFEDFDIDYNQYKYLLETRCSGTLVHPKSALIIEQEVTDNTEGTV